MPTYTYRCENCGVQFDRRQKFSDDPLKICPECEEEALRKVYLPVGIVFKGSGFYATDNRSASGMTNAKSKSEGDGNSSESSGNSGDSENTKKETVSEKSSETKTSEK
ncbi:MAG: zinc ribbon domain-containing protein [Chloroflexi bacterium]|jgi:putative FmdB family regulatory protein|nr:zinc ribbon domain-containing protein [Chloroflexota bacterium]